MTAPAAIAQGGRRTRSPIAVVSAAAPAPAIATISWPGSTAEPSHARAVNGRRNVAVCRKIAWS
jgi:hypothetical protein